MKKMSTTTKALAIAGAVILVVVLIALFGCDRAGPAPGSGDVAELGPVNPIAPELPVAPTAPDPPSSDQVLVTATEDSLHVPRLLNIGAGETKAFVLRLVPGQAAGGEITPAYEIILAQDDTTAAAMRFDGMDYFRGGLTLSDDLGRILAQAQKVAVIQARVHVPASGAPVDFEIPVEGKRAGGKALVHVYFQRAGGERLGLAEVEVRVR